MTVPDIAFNSCQANWLVAFMEIYTLKLCTWLNWRWLYIMAWYGAVNQSAKHCVTKYYILLNNFLHIQKAATRKNERSPNLEFNASTLAASFCSYEWFSKSNFLTVDIRQYESSYMLTKHAVDYQWIDKAKESESESESEAESESESESESLYSVLLQTQDTSAKTYLVAVAEATVVYQDNPGTTFLRLMRWL